MRLTVAGVALLLTGCGPGLVFHPEEMTPDQMLARATHVFIGVIEKHEIESWPFFRVHPPDGDPAEAKYWRVMRRHVRIETLLRGTEPRKVIDVYEIFWTGGTNGDWNSTQNGERDLFLVRVENGRYHVVRDWWRSIFPVTMGAHSRLPLDDSHPFWERVALMNYGVEQNVGNAHIGYPYFNYHDPTGVLGRWRTIKLQRGLARHPNPEIRVPACRELVDLGGWGQDECWESLSESDRSHLHDSGFRCCSAEEVAFQRQRVQARTAAELWSRSPIDREERRVYTAINNPRLRAEICRLYEREYPGDLDTGCPADRPPPATIVTERGDVPLTGPWPR